MDNYFLSHVFQCALSFISRLVVMNNRIIYLTNKGVVKEQVNTSKERGRFQYVTPRHLNSGVVALCASTNHCLALKSDGTVWAWGQNNFLQCGINGFGNIEEPSPITCLENIVMLSCGTYHCAALKSNGTVWHWGTIYSNKGEWKKDEAVTPVQLPGLSNIKWIFCGQEYILALDTFGHIWGYGLNYNGELNYKNAIFLDKPQIIFENTFDAISVCADLKNIYVLLSNGDTYSINISKMDTVVKQLFPVVESSVQIVALNANTSCVFALDVSGSIYSWGNDFSGQLGQGPTNYPSNHWYNNSPQKVSGLPNNVAGVGSSGNISAAVSDDDLIYVWGSSADIVSCSPVGIDLNGLKQVENTPLPIRSAYTTCYLAYLDILGFTKLVMDTKTFGSEDNSLLIRSKMDLLANLDSAFRVYGTKIAVMSDSIIITIPCHLSNSLSNFLRVVAQINGMLNGSVLRGAIVVGDVYHEDNIIFGPAFIEAYHLEEEKCCYPRIIIPQEYVRVISSLEHINFLLMDKYFLIDSDTYEYFDYLSYSRDNNLLYAVYDSVLYAIMLNYFVGENSIPTKICEKYNWLLKYYYVWSSKNKLALSRLSHSWWTEPIVYHAEEGADIRLSRPILLRKCLVISPNGNILTENNSLLQNDVTITPMNSFLKNLREQLVDGIKTDINFLPSAMGISSVHIYYDTQVKQSVFEICRYELLFSNSEHLCEDCPQQYTWKNPSNISEHEHHIIKEILKHL